MAYTSIPTVSVGDLYTASDFNTYLRDNFRAGIPDAFTAKGDLAFGEDADTIGILALGTAGQWLIGDTAETLGVKWADPVGFGEWFTFGAFTCDSLNDNQLSTGSTRENINDIWTQFSIPDTGARLFLTSLSARNTEGGLEAHFVRLTAGNAPNDTSVFLSVHVPNEVDYWNTQTGFCQSDTDVWLKISHTTQVKMNVIMRIWGYA